MSRALVTGAAGFIGSHLSERLTADGWDVTGVDSFTDFYPRWMKEANLVGLLDSPLFRLVEADLCTADCDRLLDGVDVVFHQAAQAGVRTSWGSGFGVYLDDNVLATQRLLEACKGRGLRRFVYASSSSVYGDVESLPMKETDLPRPFSPYGVTKLAAEHLALLYSRNHGVPVTALRYFTVYGPRQRPDMAFHRFIRAAITGSTITLYGEGNQTRDFTYIDDAVQANILALSEAAEGKVFNVGGGNEVTVRAVLKAIEEIAGKPVAREELPMPSGDVQHTLADSTRIRTELGWSPATSIREGLAAQHEWMLDLVARTPAP
jgi:UDP-glucose 4-epimerase